MKQLLEQMEQNSELKAKIEELDKNPDVTPQEFIEVAAEYGIELTEADFQPADSREELTDDELDAVAGGKDCLCGLGGGGMADEEGKYDKTCACVLGGGGEYADGSTRCACVVVGAGDGLGFDMLS